MFSHPDGSIWALQPHGGVVRIRGEVEDRICDGEALSIPDAGRVLLYSNRIDFYFDTARQAPVLLVSTYATDPASVLLGVWTGSRFELLAQAGAVPVLGGDGFAFDPRRGVLVHLLGGSDTSVAAMKLREGNGGVKVRELGSDGTWRDVGGVLPAMGRSRLFAGWDGRREKVVVIDEESRRTFAWDGAAWEELPDFPHMPWAPWAMATAPGHPLVYVHAERSTDHRAHAWVLREDRWEHQEAAGFSLFGGAVHDAATDACVVAAPWFGPGTIPSQWGRIAEGRLVPGGAPLFPVAGATTSGPPTLWGTCPAAGRQHPQAHQRPVCAALTEDGLAPLPPLPGPTLGVVGAGGKLWSVGPTGDVFALDLSGGTWEKRADGALIPRRHGDLGCDPASGRILLVGGEPLRGAAYLKEVWCFEDGGWRAVEAKGARPALVGARVAFHPGLGAWMVVGGRDNKYRPGDRVWLCDGKRWTSTPASWEGEESALGPTTLAWDAASSQMLAVAGGRLWVYAGEGAWRPLGRFAAAPAMVAFDDRARQVVSYTEAAEWRADVGALLDAVEPAAGPTKTPAPKKASAEPPIADAVWLRCQDGESDKFWFAALDGRVWTARWGRRGRPAQTRRAECDTPAAARAAYERQVRAKLKAGYAHAPEGEAAATIPGRIAWDMRIGAKGEDLLGGTPPGIDAARWPGCADCKHPMQFVALVHAHPERLPLAGGAAIALFACNGEFSDGACETWDADAGCNRALLLSAEDLAAPGLGAPPRGPGGEEPLAPLRRRKIGYKPHFEADPALEENAEAPADGSKLGGFPMWIQGDETPACEHCGGPMAFVAQLDEGADRGLNFGGGMGYLFACRHTAKFLWQR